MPSWRIVLLRLDEGAADVGVLHQPLPVGDAALLGVADRRRRAGLGHRDDQVGVDGELTREPAADLDPDVVDALAADLGVGAGEVDELEQAALRCGLGEVLATAARARRWRPARPGSTSRTNVAPTMSSAAVSDATTQPRSSRPSTSGRMPCGSRAAYSVPSSMKTKQYAPSMRGQDLERGLLERAVGVRRRAARSPGRCRWTRRSCRLGARAGWAARSGRHAWRARRC